jgi:CRISPR-associated protein Cas6
VQAGEMIDIVYDVAGSSVPEDHALPLLEAIVAVLPWFATTEAVGVHPLHGSATTYGELLLARRAKLILRVPVSRQDDCAALEGAELALGAQFLAVGKCARRALRPSATLHAQRVASAAPDARSFQDAVAAALGALGVASPFISGRARAGRAGERGIAGFALSVHELNAEDSLRLQAQGLGGDRRLGWGIFVPAKTITTAD